MTFSILFVMAKDPLTIRVSLVACEQVFSISGNILNKRQSRLKIDILEVLMCVKDWEFARHRYQQNQEYWIDDFDNISLGGTS